MAVTTTTIEPSIFQFKDRVKIDGENGFYWVFGRSTDGSLTLWGGDADPNGYRCYRNAFVHQVKADTRKLSKKAFPIFALAPCDSHDD